MFWVTETLKDRDKKKKEPSDWNERKKKPTTQIL